MLLFTHQETTWTWRGQFKKQMLMSITYLQTYTFCALKFAFFVFLNYNFNFTLQILTKQQKLSIDKFFVNRPWLAMVWRLKKSSCLHRFSQFLNCSSLLIAKQCIHVGTKTTPRSVPRYYSFPKLEEICEQFQTSGICSAKNPKRKARKVDAWRVDGFLVTHEVFSF